MMVVISPHLDDAVFGCGRLLASRPGSIVVTLFAGVPEDSGQLTQWDARCGFLSAAEAVSARRSEDERALALLDARPVWLDFLDSQYGKSPSAAVLASALRRTLQELQPTELVFPLGLFHSDHLIGHEATVEALKGVLDGEMIVYEDALYRSMAGLLQQRLAALARAQVTASPCAMAGEESPDDIDERKPQAIQAYASQLRALSAERIADLRHPERFWKLEPSR